MNLSKLIATLRASVPDADSYSDEQLLQALGDAIAEDAGNEQQMVKAISPKDFIQEHGIPEMGSPSPEQLKLINQYRPAGVEPYTAEDVMTISYLASDNLCWRDSPAAWTVDSLDGMAKAFAGRPFLMDHNFGGWSNGGTDDDLGFVYNATLLHSERPPKNLMGFNSKREINKDIVSRHGYYQLLLDVAIPTSSEFVAISRAGKRPDCSTTTMHDENKYICPLCETNFFGTDCPHYPPLWYLKYWLDEEDVEFAPYYLVGEFADAFELSSVRVGNLPGAYRLRHKDKRLAS